MPSAFASAERVDAAATDTDRAAFPHLRVFQDIAAANGGNRAAGTSGYDRSAEYVADVLRRAGYAVRFEEFEFPFFEERSPPRLVAGAAETAAPEGAVRSLSNSGAADVKGRLGAVDLGLTEGEAPPGASTSGCEAEDFAGFERGAVALVRRGTCPFQVKVDHAAAAGAAGVVIMNEGVEGRNDAFSGRLSRAVGVPVVGISYAFGRTLAAAARAGGGEAAVRLAVDVVSGTRTTRNVLAELPEDGGGDPTGPVVVVGAHLDSVQEGPGINDNGSGSAAVLAAAKRHAEAARSGAPPRAAPRVRFAFWGAEELGLIGSRHHVGKLSEEERRRIALYVNLDMVGSPNFGRFVQGQEGSEGPAATARRALLAYFETRGLPVQGRTGRRFRGYGSDDASFADKGVPTVSLYTGAGEPKPGAAAALFGGTPDRPYDPCYHRACDTVENIDRAVLEEMSAALTQALEAVTTEPLPPGPAPAVQSEPQQ